MDPVLRDDYERACKIFSEKLKVPWMVLTDGEIRDVERFARLHGLDEANLNAYLFFAGTQKAMMNGWGSLVLFPWRDLRQSAFLIGTGEIINTTVRVGARKTFSQRLVNFQPLGEPVLIKAEDLEFGFEGERPVLLFMVKEINGKEEAAHP